jgi:hypothetical protein
MKLINRKADRKPKPEMDGSIMAVSFDEMWHFAGKKASYRSGRLRSTVAVGHPDYVSAIVLLRRSENSTKKIQAFKRNIIFGLSEFPCGSISCGKAQNREVVRH